MKLGGHSETADPRWKTINMWIYLDKMLKNLTMLQKLDLP